MKTIRLTQNKYDTLNRLGGLLILIMILFIGGLVLSAADYLMRVILYKEWLTPNLIGIPTATIITVLFFKKHRLFPWVSIAYFLYASAFFAVQLAGANIPFSAALAIVVLICFVITGLILLYLLFSARVAVVFKSRPVEIVPETEPGNVPPVLPAVEQLFQNPVILPENPQVPAGESLEEAFGKEYWMNASPDELLEEDGGTRNGMDENDPAYRDKKTRIIAAVITGIAVIVLIAIAVAYFPPA